MKQATLSALAGILNNGGLNYSVFLRAYKVAAQRDASSKQLIHAALGEAAIPEEIERVTPEQVAAEAKSSLLYGGDDGAGPDLKSLRSERFRQLLASLLAEVEALSRSSSKVERFRLKEGHPAYPVFWDFAFLFTGSSEAIVLVGSSSD